MRVKSCGMESTCTSSLQVLRRSIFPEHRSQVWETPQRLWGSLSCQVTLVGGKGDEGMALQGELYLPFIQSVQHTCLSNGLGLHVRFQVAKAFNCCLKRKEVENHGSSITFHCIDEKTEDSRSLDPHTNACSTIQLCSLPSLTKVDYSHPMVIIGTPVDKHERHKSALTFQLKWVQI